MSKLKSKTVVFAISICLLCIIFYFFMTPIGALRLRIAVSGYPIAAFTFKVSQKTNSMEISDTQIGFTLVNPPFETKSQSELVNWVVTKKGIFYTASYYGWG